jgi:hypothetical protein
MTSTDDTLQRVGSHWHGPCMPRQACFAVELIRYKVDHEVIGRGPKDSAVDQFHEANTCSVRQKFPLILCNTDILCCGYKSPPF